MQVFVNEKKIEVDDKSNIEQLLLRLGKPLQGCAIAVNQEVINRSAWRKYKLVEGDEISLFQAIAGG